MENCSSDSDMELDMVEESEDDLNITSYFHDDIEESTDDDDINYGPSHDDETTKKPAGEYGIKDLLADDYAEVSMDVILSPTETRKSHMISCPVCFEIAILTKNSRIYDNLIAACMEKNSKK